MYFKFAFTCARSADITDCSEVFTERTAAGLRSLNSAVNGSLLLYWTSPKLCMVSLSVVPIVGVGAMSLAKYSRRFSMFFNPFTFWL